MIGWFTAIQVAVALAAGLLAVGLGLARKPPGDLSLAGTVLVEALLLGQLVVAILAPGSGNPPSGNILEFYAYLISALLVPPAAVLWALLERSRWSTVIVGIGCLAVAVMLYRMQVIWTLQGA